MRKAYITAAIAAAALSLSSCSEQRQVYEGPSYLMFSDTLTVCPVWNDSDEYCEIPLGCTRASDHDRTYGVEIVQSETNAILGYHYLVDDYTVTIPAGARAASFRIKGIYDNIESGEDSLSVTLRLVSMQDEEWDLYGSTSRVILQKAKRFDLADFTGWAVVSGGFIDSVYPNDPQRLVYTEAVPDEENTVCVKNIFLDGYDINLTFDPSDWQAPSVSIEYGGVVASTQSVLGTPLGDDKVRVMDYMTYPSTFNTLTREATLYSTFFVNGNGGGLLGNLQTDIRWITDQEKDDILNNGF